MLEKLKTKLNNLPEKHKFIAIAILAVLAVFLISGIIGGLVFMLPTWVTVILIIAMLCGVIYVAWRKG